MNRNWFMISMNFKERIASAYTDTVINMDKTPLERGFRVIESFHCGTENAKYLPFADAKTIPHR